MRAFTIGLAASLMCASGANCAEGGAPGQYEAMIAKHAKANGVPEALVHRIIVRESRYNPRARNGPYWGMMQMSVPTARGAGFRGPPSALLDAETNLAYGVRYLAGAYRTAAGNLDRAVGYYARGYYYAAKRQGLLAKIGMGRDGKLTAPTTAVATAAQTAAPEAPAATNFQLASTAAAPSPARAAVPMPPARGATPQSAAVATVSANTTVPKQAEPQTIDPKAAGPVLAAAVPPQPRDASSVPGQQAARAPVPPVRSATAQAAVSQVAAAPTPRDVVAGRRDAPVTTGSIPIRTAATESARPAAPTPPTAPAAPNPLRVVSPEAAPALAGAGPLPPSRPSTPVPTPRPAAASPELAYAGAPRPATEGAVGQLRGPNLPLPPRR